MHSTLRGLGFQICVAQEAGFEVSLGSSLLPTAFVDETRSLMRI